jgi:oxalate decarboxylase/phosphoglucose isomerase-like protein (cupin superfamily)
MRIANPHKFKVMSELRISDRITAESSVNMRLTAGSYRELHWHTADEWAYVLYGKARVTVMSPDGKMLIGDVGEGDLWLFPAGHPHSRYLPVHLSHESARHK